MDTREITCIMCPVGCLMTCAFEDGEVKVAGNECGRGRLYGRQEFTDPRRIVTSTVMVSGGAKPLCPVKTAGAVPFAAIGEVLRAIQFARPEAPVNAGEVLIKDAAGTGVDIVATSAVDRAAP